MEGNMFCYQCQEAAKGTGCVLRGVCGKKDTTARYMDLLLFVVRGVSVAADTLRTKGYEVEAGTNEFVIKISGNRSFVWFKGSLPFCGMGRAC